MKWIARADNVDKKSGDDTGGIQLTFPLQDANVGQFVNTNDEMGEGERLDPRDGDNETEHGAGNLGDGTEGEQHATPVEGENNAIAPITTEKKHQVVMRLSRMNFDRRKWKQSVNLTTTAMMAKRSSVRRRIRNITQLVWLSHLRVTSNINRF